MSSWTWAAAACRGTSHARDNTRKQDAFACRIAGDKALIATVCDGAGSALKGGEGASIVCRGISTLAHTWATRHDEFPSDEIVESWVSEIRARLQLAANNRKLKTKDFASTLVMAVSCGEVTMTIHIGDGSVVAQCALSRSWIPLSWPQHGEYASTTFFVTDDQLKLTIHRHYSPISAIAVFTDGIERLALNFTSQSAHEPFFEGMMHPVFQSTAGGRDNKLSEQLYSFLDSSAVNSRTDDDKTLLLAVKR